MVTLDIKDYEPPNPFEHAANALDDLAFVAKWPKRMREARLTVVKVLVALRNIESVPGGLATLDVGMNLSPAHALVVWNRMVDAILKDAPPEMLE